MKQFAKELDTTLTLLMTNGARAATTFQTDIVKMQAEAEATKLRIRYTTYQYERAVKQAVREAEQQPTTKR